MMDAPKPPPRVWVRFVEGEPPSSPLADLRVQRYQVEETRTVRGEPLRVNGILSRIESNHALPEGAGELAGVTQHLVYTTREERARLGALSATESGPYAVLIPIKKSAAWWALAQDERDGLMRGRHPDATERTDAAPGHIATGLDYASRIFRRLIHARPLPGSRWDFLTYFEFPEPHADAFRELLAALRDERTNPEWAFVERETELWMRKL